MIQTNGNWWIEDGNSESPSLTGTWMDITTLDGKEINNQNINKYLKTQKKDLMKNRINNQFGFKGVEIIHSDQFKLGTKIFKIELINM